MGIMILPRGRWTSISERPVRDLAGVYAVRLVDGDRSPRLVRRFLDEDDEGLLCLGQSKNLEQRRTQFINGVQKCVGHSEANLLHLLGLHARTRARAQLENVLSMLEWRVEYCSPKKREEELIKSYIKRFGEAPPLNSAIPNRYGLW